tara:strand:+ start:49952 stop:50341 length:390 start_codon:yes stop_codon:yes gene_type:complete
MRFSEILNQITGGINPLCTIREVSDVMGRNTQTVYGYRNEQSQPDFEDVKRLSRYLIKEYGYYRLAYQMFLVCKGGKTNGMINDQLLEMMEHGTDCHRAFEAKDKTKAMNAYGKIEEQMKILKQEIEQL